MIKGFTPRLYQQTILGTISFKNTLVVLPTGLGKTALAFLLAAQRLAQYPKGKILMLAPTKPLCEQHVQTFQKYLDIDAEKVVLFTGSVKPTKRAEMWKDAQVIISTPQGLENDVINKRVNLNDVVLLVFDEAHHATKDYAYVWVAKQYMKAPKSRILGLTASPGSDMMKIKEVCQNLGIERVEVRTDKDPDVKPYVQDIELNWEKVPFPEEFKKVQTFLKNSRKSKILEAKKHGYADRIEMTKTGLLRLQGDLQRKISSGERDFEIMRSVSLIAEALKVDHALELLESQGLRPLQEYFTKIRQQAITSRVKAVKNLVMDLNFKSAAHVTEGLLEKKVMHPKLIRLQELIGDVVREKGKKAIVFTQYRDTAEEIIKVLNVIGVSNHIFVGQAKKKGLGFSQKEQKKILDRFRVGEFSVLVATSVAEEGLDIPKVEKVVFYEPVPSAIRSIQRRGRTGRLEDGGVTVLLTEGTRDEAYRWAAHHKEKRMYRNLEKLRKEFSFLQEEKNETLQRFIPKEQVVAVVADHREKDNRIVKELIDLGVGVTTAQLESADYVLSGKVGVELKKVPDFVASLIDGRLLEQVRDLKRNFAKSVLIVEGEQDMYSVRKVHANSIRGMLSSIVLDYGVPVLYTKNPRDTASLLAVMAKREQGKEYGFTYHQQKPKGMKEQQEFIVAALPSVGVSMARKLLEHFGSVEKVFAATKEDFVAIDGVGEKTALRILDVVQKEYKKKKET